MRKFAIAIVIASLGTVYADNGIGKRIEEFELQDFRGATHALSDVPQSNLVVVAFMGIECPLAKLYAPRLNDLAKEYADKGVTVFAIDSNRQDSITEMEHFANKNKLVYPFLKDSGNRVADQFDAVRTPEFYLLDRDRIVRYRGRFDDQYGVGYIRPASTSNDLTNAIDTLLRNEVVQVAHTPAPGCFIGRIRKADEKSDVTYSNQIARIFQERCVECHRPGQIAPFSMTSYSEVVGWAETIAEVVQDQRMPPWHASPDHGDFINDAKLSQADKELIYEWVEAGAPEGNPADLPAPAQFAEGWRIPEPDLVLEMNEEFDVPATGEVPYQYFVLDPKLTEDKWITAAECVAGNPTVVHHNIAFIVPPEFAQHLPAGHFSTRRPDAFREPKAESGNNSKEREPQIGQKRLPIPGDIQTRIGIMRSWFTNYLVAMAPGTPPMNLRDGLAKRIEAGSKIVFQMHYTPTGTPQKDRSRIGLVFASDNQVKREVVTRSVLEQRFEIPPYAPNHEVTGFVRFRDDTYLLEVFPHMHVRGKSFRYTLRYPDGRTEILLDVPRYDFAWQNIYTLREPKLLPRGTVLECVAHFDNSEANLSNPDPSATVRFGDQTWEEMMIGFFNMALAREGEYVDPERTRAEQFLAMAIDSDDPRRSELHARAAKALQSDEDFDRFWDLMAARFPQLDRIDVGLADGLQFRWERVAQGLEIPSTMRMKQLPSQLNVAGPVLGLYQCAIKRETTVYNGDRTPKGMEMQFLSRILPSSVHVPLRVNGKAASVNFWSTDRNAFPPEAVAALEAIVHTMKDSSSRATARK